MLTKIVEGAEPALFSSRVVTDVHTLPDMQFAKPAGDSDKAGRGAVRTGAPVVLCHNGSYLDVACVCSWRESFPAGVADGWVLARRARDTHVRRHDSGSGFFDGSCRWVNVGNRDRTGRLRRDMAAYDRALGGPDLGCDAARSVGQEIALTEVELGPLTGYEDIPPTMSPKTFARILEVTTVTLERWRDDHDQQKGPEWSQIPGSNVIRYLRADVIARLGKHRVQRGQP